ncbi:Dihydroneopterin aldolase [Ehrlichia minasensis]|nr:Dihydroneopterin aldolase [Ehrlichia minasensis]
MKIQIHDLAVYTCIGLRCWERVIRQKIIVDCNVTLYCHNAICDIEDTIDYSLFTDSLINFANSNSFELLETMASNLLDYIMQDKKICHCYLKLYKPIAISIDGKISVELESAQNDVST